jgi:hypothetical protein
MNAVNLGEHSRKRLLSPGFLTDDGKDRSTSSQNNL